MSEAYQPRPGIPFVVLALAIAIIAAFALTGQWAPDTHLGIYEVLGVISARFYPGNPEHYTNFVQPLVPIFGHAFAHFGWPHILMNMIAYFQAAPFVARRLGGVRFLILFFVSAIGSALAFILLAPNDGPMAGASGAICGVFGAYFLSVRPTPRAALADPIVRNALVMFVGINVVLFALLPVGIAWQAHLGGFIAGALAYPLLAPRTRGPWG